MALSAESKEYYDRELDGMPINDMDSIITMNDFSSLVMYVGLPRQGITPTKQEVADYLAVWRYICYIMGTPDWFLETPEQARAMMESIFAAEVKPDPATSGTISNNMINGLVGQAPSYASRGFLVAMAHWMNGTELATALEIEKPTLYYKTLMAGQCWLFMILAYSRRALPFFDDAINKVSQKAIYDALVHDKKKGGLGYKAKFTFKWIPALDFRTSPSDTEAERVRKSGLFAHFGPEAISLTTLLLTAAFTIGGALKGASTVQRLGLLPAWLKY
jgi:hypothetical protein